MNRHVVYVSLCPDPHRHDRSVSVTSLVRCNFVYAITHTAQLLQEADAKWRTCSIRRLERERIGLAKDRTGDAAWLTLASLRANHTHPLKDSILDLVPMILDMIGGADHDACYIRAAGTFLFHRVLSEDALQKLIVQLQAFDQPLYDVRQHGTTSPPGEWYRLGPCIAADPTHDMYSSFPSLFSLPWAPVEDFVPYRRLCVAHAQEIKRRLAEILNSRYARDVVSKGGVAHPI